MLREQEELDPAEIGGEDIAEDCLVNPRRIGSYPGKPQHGPCDFVNYVDHLDIPADDYSRLEQHGLVERGLGEQLPLAGDLFR